MGENQEITSRMAMKSDAIGKVLILLFIIKPALDLLWFFPLFSIAGKPISLLHLTGVLVLVYFGRYLLVFNKSSPPYALIFKLLIITYIISAVITMFTERVSPVYFSDLMIRIIDSYIIYNVAYFSALNHDTKYYNKLVLSISIGVSIALIINFFAIISGYEGRIVTSGTTQRVSGLYSDPGVVANVAVYAIVFTTFMANMLPGRSISRRIYTGFVLIVAFYIIFTGLSRSAFILLCVFGVIYITLFKKGILSRIAAPVFLAIIFVIGAMSGLDYYKYVDRFQSEINVITDSGDFKSKQDKDVDFGKLEHLGSNRGQVIAYALDSILKRPMYQLVFGNFNQSPSHTDYVDLLSRNGFIGLVLYLILLFSIWKKLFKYSLNRKQGGIEWKLCVLGFILISMYILYAIPFRPLHYTTIAWFMWAILGCAFGAVDSMEYNRKKSVNNAKEPVINRRILKARTRSMRS